MDVWFLDTKVSAMFICQIHALMGSNQRPLEISGIPKEVCTSHMMLVEGNLEAGLVDHSFLMI